MKLLRSMRVAAAFVFGLCVNAALAAAPDGKSYRISVYSNFGTFFTQCISFNTSGGLAVGGYGTLVYTHDQLNNESSSWQAIPNGPISGIILSFHGAVGGDDAETIHANATNSFGDTFILQGVAVASCANGSSLAASAASPWQKP